ncbi:EMB2654 [Symbiodinium sp. CCMP2456]|nr:EMB2654 [Symbiodinium sp. CCMP2456]
MRPSKGDPSKTSSSRSCSQRGTAGAGQQRSWTNTNSFCDGRSNSPLQRFQQADHFSNATSLPIVYNRSISACRRYAGWEEALRILHGLRSVSLQCDLVGCSSAMSVCDAASQWQRATALLETTKATLGPPDVIMYGAEMNACQKGRQWQRAIRLLKDLRRSLRADLVTLNTAMCGPSSGEWQNATHLLEEGASWSLQPSMVSYNVAMRSSSWRRAAEFLMAAGRNKLRSTVTTCGTMLSRCELPWAAELVHLSQMQSQQLEPNVITLSSVLSALAVASWETSLDLLAEAQKREMQPNEFALSAATSGCEQSAEWEIASHLLREVGVGLQASLSWNAAASAAATGSAWGHVVALLRTLPTQSLRADLLTMSAAVSSMVGHRRWTYALFFLCEHSVLSTESDVVIYSAGMTSCEECQEWRWALQLLKASDKALGPANDIAFNAVVAACEQGERGHASESQSEKA